MVKTFHEAPKSIFKDVQEITSGDYFLVHLFETDSEYLNLARESVRQGRETILDNSIFELGEAFDMAKFADWVRELKPTYYIVPDALEDFTKTKENMTRWNKEFRATVPGKMIGVCQGKSYEEQAACYEWLVNEAGVDKIAIPFDASWYREAFPCGEYGNKLISWCFGRILFINRMLKEGRICKEKPHHLLGCSLPQEFKYYSSISHGFIDSVDTSNPVTTGMLGWKYREDGLWIKPVGKMCDMMDEEIKASEWVCIRENIHKFNEFCNTNYIV